jgi:hypothetical protein
MANVRHHVLYLFMKANPKIPHNLHNAFLVHLIVFNAEAHHRIVPHVIKTILYKTQAVFLNAVKVII